MSRWIPFPYRVAIAMTAILAPSCARDDDGDDATVADDSAGTTQSPADTGTSTAADSGSGGESSPSSGAETTEGGSSGNADSLASDGSAGSGDSSGSDGASTEGSEGSSDGGLVTTCGDGVLDPDEECDDADNQAGDGCGSHCLLEVGLSVRTGAATCVLTGGGDVRCWGMGLQLGYGEAAGCTTCDDGPNCCMGDDEPAAAAGVVDVGGAVVDLAVGVQHTCAVLAGGAVRCWGIGSSGALGYGNVENVGDDETPASVGDVDVGGTAVQIVTGSYHTCALLDDGAVRCWGSGGSGAVGHGSISNVGDNETPASIGEVDLGGPVAELRAGGMFNCARLQDQTVRCWGANWSGQLGIGTTANVGDDEKPASSAAVALSGPVVQLDAGFEHTCALLQGGTIQCWGRGVFGALGYGGVENVGDDETPQSVGTVPLGAAATHVSLGSSHSCALVEGGAVRCWGSNAFGALGNAAGFCPLPLECAGLPTACCIGNDETPASVDDVDIGAEVVELAVGSVHTCFRTTLDTVRCWGNGKFGALGFGDTETVGDDELPSSVGDVPVF